MYSVIVIGIILFVIVLLILIGRLIYKQEEQEKKIDGLIRTVSDQNGSIDLLYKMITRKTDNNVTSK